MDIIRYTEENRFDKNCEYQFVRHIKHDNDVKVHCHEFFELQFFPNQAFSHLANSVVTEFPKSTLLFIRPDDCHDTLNPRRETIHIIHLAVSKKLIGQVFAYLTDAFPSRELLESPMPPHVVLNALESVELQNSFNEITAIDIHDYGARNLFIRQLLIQIFYRHFAKLHGSAQQFIPQWLQETCEKMRYIEHFSQGIDQMTKLSGRTKSHLCRSMQRYMNTTPSAFINEVRLIWIANMLVSTDAEILELCYEAGFSNISWMYTLFKEKYGQSPGAFRKAAMQPHSRR